MPEEATTTALIYQREADILTIRYGKPIRNALRTALSGCQHPEDKRVPTDAIVSQAPGEAVNREGGNKTVFGFYCRKCRRYVFDEQANK